MGLFNHGIKTSLREGKLKMIRLLVGRVQSGYSYPRHFAQIVSQENPPLCPNKKKKKSDLKYLSLMQMKLIHIISFLHLFEEKKQKQKKKNKKKKKEK